MARLLVVAAAFVLLVALVAGYARRAVVDSDQFANRATAALRDAGVRTLVADELTDRVVLAKERDLLAARPLIASATAGVIGSPAFTSLFHAAVRDVHRAVFGRDQNTVTLAIADAGTVIAAALERLRPELAAQVEDIGQVELTSRDLSSAGGELARLADDVRLLAPLLLGAGILLAVGAVALQRDRRRGVVELGTAVAGAGVLLVVAYGVARSAAVGRLDTPEQQAAARAVWGAFLGDLRIAAWIMAGSGAVVAAAAASLLRPVGLREPLRRAVAWLATEPRRPWLRVLRGAGFVAAGVLVIVARDTVLDLALTLVGVYAIYGGLTAILRVVYRAPVAERPARPPRRRLAVPLIAAAIVAGAVAVFVGTGGTTTAAPARGSCNGHAALCDRPLDEVVLPATHNSMSVPLRGWYASLQDRSIADQLAYGIRGLLIDTHYADRLGNGRLRTYFGSTESLPAQAERDGVSPDAVAAAMRLRERAGFAGEGERGMYLCHSFCELGGTPLETVLDDIHDFLITHPEDVVVVINQDYVTPEDFVAAVEDADLTDLVLTPPRGARWPTLGELVEQDRRVLFLAENQAGAAPWYQLVYERLTKETPYAFSRAAELTSPARLAETCEPNRGPEQAPLFLVNHWVTTDPLPRPSDAAAVNAYEPLLARAEACRDGREHIPNLLAVNFYLEGDLLRVVDELNGVG